MKKTIFSRILSTNFTILISALAFAMLIVAILYGQVLMQQQRELLVRMADELESITSENAQDAALLQREVNQLANWTSTKIYLLNMDEKRSDVIMKALQKETLSPFIQEDLQIILKGNEVYRGLQFSNFFGAYTVFLGRPLYTEGHITGVVLLFKPLNELPKGLLLIGGVFLIVVSSVVVVGFLLIQWSTRKITAPILTLAEAAQKIAHKQSVADLPITDQNELGDLTVVFNHMKNKLEAHNQEKSAFMAMVSHDLKTPLMSINGYIEALMDGVISPEELQPTLNRVHDEITRLTRLTQDLLSVSRSQEMSFMMRPDIFNYSVLLQEAVENLNRYGNKPVIHDIQSPTEIWVKADRDKMMQILMNLFSNAYKFSKESCHIGITCHVEEGYMLHLEIRDTGLGIPESQLQTIFEPMVRLHGHLSGEGLGLSITKKLVEMHSGEIVAESKLGVQTIFRLKMPIVVEVIQ